MTGTANRQAWEDWGEVDPLWAVLTEPDAQFGRWDAGAFFASGRDLIAGVMADADRLGHPRSRTNALDFGCGVGRLTQALGAHFHRVVGVDVASTMIRKANEFNTDLPGVTFVVNDDDNLSRFDDGAFDLVCSLLVLQHLPSLEVVTTFLSEFVRVLAPGGLVVVQLPTSVPAPTPAGGLRRRIAPRTRLARGLRCVGVSKEFLYRRLRWRPEMLMTAVPADNVVAVLETAGARLLRIAEPTVGPHRVESRVYYATR